MSILYHPDTLTPMGPAEGKGGCGFSVRDVLGPLAETPPAFSAAVRQIELIARAPGHPRQAGDRLRHVSTTGSPELRAKVPVQVQRLSGPTATRTRERSSERFSAPERPVASELSLAEAEDAVGGQHGFVSLGEATTLAAATQLTPQDRPTKSLAEAEDAVGGPQGFVSLEEATTLAEATQLKPQDRPTKSLASDTDKRISVSQPTVLAHKQLLSPVHVLSAEHGTETTKDSEARTSRPGWINRLTAQAFGPKPDMGPTVEVETGQSVRGIAAAAALRILQ
jgi:hypothetical protein